MSEAVLRRVFDTVRDAPNVTVCLATRGHDDAPELRSLPMTQPLQEEFKRVARELCVWYEGQLRAGDLALHEFDAAFKPEDQDLEWLQLDDLDVINRYVNCVPNPVVNAQMFDADEQFMSRLWFYVIVVERQGHERVLFFRKYSPQKELTRSRLFGAIMADGIYDKIRQPVFMFDDKIDSFSSENIIYVVRKHEFQQSFHFFDKLREKATESLNTIREHVPISNFDAFQESCTTHVVKMMKLKNIATSPYLRNVTMDDLRRTIRRFNLQGVRVIGRGRNRQLEFDPANRWVILKLLNDDYLASVMTRVQYEVNSKHALAR